MKREDQALKTCGNCGTPLPEKAEFCHQCGQKYLGGKVPLSDLFKELGDAFFNLDSKIINTVIDIWWPGRLTKKYFAGQRKRYVHPARLFFVLAIVYLAVLNWRVLYMAEENLESMSQGLRETAYKDQALDKVHAKIDSIRLLEPANRDWQAALDTLDQVVGGSELDSTGLGIIQLESRNLKIDNRDLATMSPDSLVEKYQVEGWFQRRLVRQFIQVMQHGGDFWKFALGQMTWMLLVLMPVIALWMKLLYIRRSRYFIEHLYWSFHTQSFVFLASILVMIIGHDQEWLWSLAFIGAVVYIFMAQYRYYAQSVGKTLLKFFLLGYFYITVIWIFIGLTLLIAGLVYA